MARAELNPVSTVEFDQIQLLDLAIVGRASRDSDSRTEHPNLQVEACGLFHHVGAGQVVATFLQNLNKRLCDFISIHVVGSSITCLRIVFLHPFEKLMHCGNVYPVRTGPAFGTGVRDDSDVRYANHGGDPARQHYARLVNDLANPGPRQDHEPSHHY